MSCGIVLFSEVYTFYNTAFIADYKSNYENNWKLIISDFKHGLAKHGAFEYFCCCCFNNYGGHTPDGFVRMLVAAVPVGDLCLRVCP